MGVVCINIPEIPGFSSPMRLREFTLQLIPDDRIPLFQRAARAIVQAIRQERIQPGQALPGTRSLAEQLGVNRSTVIQAIQELEAEGWVVTHPNRGTFVAEALPERMDGFGALTMKADAPSTSSHREPAFDLPSRLKPLTQTDSDALDLSDGLPDASLAPVDELGKAYQRALRRHGEALLQHREPMGQALLRDQLAGWLSERRGLRVSPEQILITRGSRAALALIALSLFREGDSVAVEHPGNRFAWNAFQQSVPVQLEPIAVDTHGMDVCELESTLSRTDCRAIYTTPQRQFPTTVVMSAERRSRLLELAAQHRIPLIEDDHDSDFTFGDQPILPLASQDLVGQVVYTTSLGRLMAPGIRLGCIVGSADLVDKLARVQRNLELHGDHVAEWAAADLIRDGDLGRQLRKARKIYEERMHFLVKHLQQQFGEMLEIRVPGGGLALWIRFLVPEMASSWIDAMRIRGLVLNQPRNYFLTKPGPFTRMGFAQVSESALGTAIEKMSLALKDIS